MVARGGCYGHEVEHAPRRGARVAKELQTHAGEKYQNGVGDTHT